MKMHMSAFIGGCLCAAASLAQVFPPPTIYVQSQVPLFSDGTYTFSFGYPIVLSIDDQNRVFVDAQCYGGLTATEEAIFTSDAGTIQLIGNKRTLGAALSPPSSQSINSIESTAFTPSGVAFIDVVGGGQAQILMKRFGQPLHGITDSTNPAPGVASFNLPVTAPSSATVVITLDATANDLWVGDTSSEPVPFTRVFTHGQQISGLAPGIVAFNPPYMYRINASGRYAFATLLTGASVSTNSDTAIVVGQGATQSVALREGDPAPGVPGGTIFSLLPGNGNDLLFLSDSGEIIFQASVAAGAAGGQVIYAGPPNALVPIVPPGLNVIAGVTGRANNFRFDMSPGGQRVIWAGVDTTGSSGGYNHSVLFRGTAGSPQIIARTGQTAPGLPAGTTFTHMTDFIVNDQGWVVFRSGFTASAAFPTGGTAVFGWTGGPGPFLVLAPGDSIPLGGGVVKQVVSTQPFLNGSRNTQFNTNGTVVISVGLTGGAAAIIGRNINVPPPPVGFSLLTPQANAQSLSIQPTLAWSPSSNADSYAVSITPEGGSTTVINTAATSIAVPSGLLQGCQNITWGVSAVNASGSTASQPVTQMFTTFSLGCITPPVYSIGHLGLTGSVHQTAIVTLVSPEGRVGGYNQRYAGSTQAGQDAWIWDGQMSPPLGLTGAAYEVGALSELKRSSSVTAINAEGKVIGSSLRYASGGASTVGSDAWFYNATAVSLIGLTGPGYDQTPGSATTRRSNSAVAINDSGLVIGGTGRWSPTGSGTVLGNDAWLFDGSSTHVIGLSGPGYDSVNLGETQHSASAVAINHSGQILGNTTRYVSATTNIGQDSWLQTGADIATIQLGGGEFEHQFAAGLQRVTSATLLNDAGQVAGTASRWNSAGTFLGLSAFFWANGSFQLIDPTDAVHSKAVASGGIFRGPSVKAISADGKVVGESTRYGAAGDDLGADVWYFDGAQTRILGLSGPTLQIPSDAPDASARKLNHFIAMNAAGQILGRTDYHPIGGFTATAGWLFDPATNQITPIPTVAPAATGLSIDLALTEQGAVVGTYVSPNAAGTGIVSTSFIWSPATGMRNLESRVLGGLIPQGWEILTRPIGGAGAATHSWPNLIAGNGSFPTDPSQTAFVLQYVPAPGGFPLVAPADGASVGTAQPTHTWAASPGATSYTIAFTPTGGVGPTTTIETTSTSITLPAALAADCEHIVWTVVANAPTGSTVSTPPTRSFSFQLADFNQSGVISVQDIFDFLAAWFTGDPRADFNGVNGIDVQDIFSYLTAWFAGCS